MLDSKLLRQNLQAVAEQLARRGYQLDTVNFTRLEEQRKRLQTQVQDLQSQRNLQAKKIGQAKAQGASIQEILVHENSVSEALKEAERQLEEITQELDDYLAGIPNILHASVPDGKDETENVELRRWGELPNFDFTPKDHTELGEALNLIDFAAATKLTGSRFVVLYQQLARLHRALIQFMLDTHINEHGYREVYVPYMVNASSMFATGQLPKMAEDLFALQGEQNYYLIPTAEVPVTNLARDVVFTENELPLKFICHSPCFRSEAGSYGKDTRGMLRQHQFEKVEMVQLVKPESSWQAHEAMTGHAEKILQKLKLPYRVVVLCSGDTGFASAKTHDLEVWLPGQATYREISSCSNMEDFQARRLKARWKNPATGKNEFIHTLNGSGLAVGRTLIAVIENYQDEKGNIRIPEVLKPYMGGSEIISTLRN